MTFIDSQLGPLIEYKEPSLFEYSYHVIICYQELESTFVEKKKRRESTFVTLIYQMIMTVNAVSNFALSQMSNSEYNNIH